jgi:hypothetical protein
MKCAELVPSPTPSETQGILAAMEDLQKSLLTKNAALAVQEVRVNFKPAKPHRK